MAGSADMSLNRRVPWVVTSYLSTRKCALPRQFAVTPTGRGIQFGETLHPRSSDVDNTGRSLGTSTCIFVQEVCRTGESLVAPSLRRTELRPARLRDLPLLSAGSYCRQSTALYVVKVHGKKPHPQSTTTIITPPCRVKSTRPPL